MSEIKTGGPAFPTNDVCYNGMTLRDYFAAKALQGWLSTYPTEMDISNVNKEFVAKHMYEMADAMLKVRNQ